MHVYILVGEVCDLLNLENYSAKSFNHGNPRKLSTSKIERYTVCTFSGRIFYFMRLQWAGFYLCTFIIQWAWFYFMHLRTSVGRVLLSTFIIQWVGFYVMHLHNSVGSLHNSVGRVLLYAPSYFNGQGFTYAPSQFSGQGFTLCAFSGQGFTYAPSQFSGQGFTLCAFSGQGFTLCAFTIQWAGFYVMHLHNVVGGVLLYAPP